MQECVNVRFANNGTKLINLHLAVRGDEQVDVRPITGIRQISSRSKHSNFVNPFGFAELDNQAIHVKWVLIRHGCQAEVSETKKTRLRWSLQQSIAWGLDLNSIK